MRGDLFIFDNVVHMYDNRPDNIVDPAAMEFQDKLTAAFSVPGAVPSVKGKAETIDDALKKLFVDSEADMAMAQTVPLFSYWREGFAPARLQYELKEAAPDRIIFCGGVDPVFQGINGAKTELVRQATEWDAKSFKFYQGHKGGLSWRADDRQLAYPLYEAMLEQGITVAQFHKGFPMGQEHIEDLRPNDVQQAALDFPDMTFILHHFGIPYIDETVNIAARFENVWLSLSAIINMAPTAPWTVYDIIGKALGNVGADRMVWGSEGFAPPKLQPFIDAFADMEIPVEMQERYGYPALTAIMKRKILGLNMARAMGIDVSTTLKGLYPSMDAAVADRAAMAE